MVRLLYTVALYCATPVLISRLLWRGARNPAIVQRIGERLGFGARIGAERGSVWIHAASVGEIQAAAPIVKALKIRYPQRPIVVTSVAPTGVAHISKAFGDGVVHRCVPFDLPDAVARFLRRVEPGVAIVMGTEIRPNLLARCRVRAVPVILANIRLSERAAAGYRRFRGLFEPALRGVAAIAVQSEEDARRIAAVGAPPEIVDVTGNTKLDVPILASLREEAAALRRTWGPSRGIWIAASTHAGEEQQVFDAFEQVAGTPARQPSGAGAAPPRTIQGGGGARAPARVRPRHAFPQTHRLHRDAGPEPLAEAIARILRDALTRAVATKADVAAQGAALERKITEQGAALERKLAALERKITEQGAALERKITEQGAALERKITEQGAALDRKITERYATLNERITRQGVELREMIAENARQLIRLGADVAALRAEMRTMRWMLGFVLALLLTMLARSFGFI